MQMQMQTQNSPTKLIFSSVLKSHWGFFFLESLWNPSISSSADAIFFFLFSFSKSDGVPSALPAGAVISFSPILNDDIHWIDA